jgi:methyl-accepting chemotaxis protein
MEKRVSDSVSTVEATLKDFEDIVAVVEEVNAEVQGISDATDDQAETSQEVVELVDKVSEISEDTNSEAENVAAAAQEQTASISEVTSNVRSLADRSDDLQALLAEFTVAGSADSRPGTDETAPTVSAEQD